MSDVVADEEDTFALCAFALCVVSRPVSQPILS
jgi:hypothetical protein